MIIKGIFDEYDRRDLKTDQVDFRIGDVTTDDKGSPLKMAKAHVKPIFRTLPVTISEVDRIPNNKEGLFEAIRRRQLVVAED